jgi:hypothetical protein
MRGLGRPVALFVAAAALTAPAPAAATLTIGSDLGRSPNQTFVCGAVGALGCTAVQSALDGDVQAPNGIYSPVNGTVTRWRIHAGASNTTPVRLRVVKPLGGDLYTGAGTSDVFDPPAGAITSFPVQLPIAMGDQIGLDFQSGANFFVNSPGIGTRLGFQPPLVDGAAGRFADDVRNDREVPINADIEPTSIFALGGVDRRKRGRLVLTPTLPNPGILKAGDVGDAFAASSAAKKRLRLLKASTVGVAAPGSTSLTVFPTKAARAALARHLKVKANLKVTFTPYGGSPSSRIVQVRLRR